MTKKNKDKTKGKIRISGSFKKEQIEYVKVNKEKFEIAISDIKEVSEFLVGISLMVDKDKEYQVTSRAHKLTNAIQWLHNWGDEDGKK